MYNEDTNERMGGVGVQRAGKWNKTNGHIHVAVDCAHEEYTK